VSTLQFYRIRSGLVFGGQVNDAGRETAAMALAQAKRAEELAKQAVAKLDKVEKTTLALAEALRGENEDLIEQIEELKAANDTVMTWKHYLLMALSVLGILAFINIFGKPLLRVCACVYLKRFSPTPRQIVKVASN